MRAGYGSLAAGLLLGIAGFAISLPMARDALVRLPGNPLLEDVNGFRPLSAENRRLFEESRLSVGPDGGREIARMLLAEPDTSDEATAARLTRAISLLEASLAVSPADTFAWADLALARFRRDGPSWDGVSALRLSILSAPAEPALVTWRLAMMLDQIFFMSVEDFRLAVQQAEIGWRYNPRGTVRVLSQRDMDHVLTAPLADTPEELERYQAIRASLR